MVWRGDSTHASSAATTGTGVRPCTPSALAQKPIDELRRCGLSGQKVIYLQGLAVAFGEWTGPDGLTDHMLERLDDEQVFAALKALPGIGPWWGRPTPPYVAVGRCGHTDVLDATGPHSHVTTLMCWMLPGLIYLVT